MYFLALIVVVVPGHRQVLEEAATALDADRDPLDAAIPLATLPTSTLSRERSGDRPWPQRLMSKTTNSVAIAAQQPCPGTNSHATSTGSAAAPNGNGTLRFPSGGSETSLHAGDRLSVSPHGGGTVRQPTSDDLGPEQEFPIHGLGDVPRRPPQGVERSACSLGEDGCPNGSEGRHGYVGVRSDEDAMTIEVDIDIDEDFPSLLEQELVRRKRHRRAVNGITSALFVSSSCSTDRTTPSLVATTTRTAQPRDVCGALSRLELR